jgi:hypothetical protein
LQKEKDLWLETVEAEHGNHSKRLWPTRRTVKTQPVESRTVNRDQHPVETIRDAIKEVRESQSEWKGKKRLADGKVQGVFLKLFQTLDGYSSVLSILPSNEYSSVFCGAVKFLVKVRLDNLIISTYGMA